MIEVLFLEAEKESKVNSPMINHSLIDKRRTNKKLIYKLMFKTLK
jgi:hypothetical protein